MRVLNYSSDLYREICEIAIFIWYEKPSSRKQEGISLSFSSHSPECTTHFDSLSVTKNLPFREHESFGGHYHSPFKLPWRSSGRTAQDWQ